MFLIASLWRAAVHVVVEVLDAHCNVFHVADAVAVRVNAAVCTVNADPLGIWWATMESSYRFIKTIRLSRISKNGWHSLTF